MSQKHACTLIPIFKDGMFVSRYYTKLTIFYFSIRKGISKLKQPSVYRSSLSLIYSFHRLFSFPLPQSLSYFSSLPLCTFLSSHVSLIWPLLGAYVGETNCNVRRIIKPIHCFSFKSMCIKSLGHYPKH